MVPSMRIALRGEARGVISRLGVYHARIAIRSQLCASAITTDLQERNTSTQRCGYRKAGLSRYTP